MPFCTLWNLLQGGVWAMSFQKFASMQPMTPSCMLTWEKCFWKMHKPSYIKSLLGFKSLRGVDKSGKRLSLKSGYRLESWKPLQKFSLLIILSFFKKPLNMSMPSTFVITVNISSYRQKYRLDQLKQFHVLWYKLSHLLLGNVYWICLETSSLLSNALHVAIVVNV